jgi:hypothetical protein
MPEIPANALRSFGSIDVIGCSLSRAWLCG